MITFNQGEEVVLEARRHWIVIAPLFLVLAVLAVAPVVLYGVFDALPVALETPGWGPALLGFAYSGYLLALWVGGYLAWLDYHLDIWIVTNQRLIDVEQKGIFRREVSSLHLGRIQDITAEVDGLLATTLKFGQIKVQTASEAKEFTIDNIASPHLVVEAVSRLIAGQGKVASIEL